MRLALPLPMFVCRPAASIALWWRFQAPYSIARYRRAFAYATGRMKPEQAARILWDCFDPAGIHPLVTLCSETVLEAARERWADHPDLESLAAEAAAHVGDKWSGDGETQGAACDWALNVIEERAAEAGIELKELDDWNG